MKPKDLLQHLEKGDRTLHHLTKEQNGSPVSPFAQRLSDVTIDWANQRAAMQNTHNWQLQQLGQIAPRQGMWSGTYQSGNLQGGIFQ